MTAATRLHLHEEALLLALRDREGTLYSGTSWSLAMGGAVLAELLLSGRITSETKRRLVTLVNDEPFGDPILDAALEKLAEARRRASMQTWVSRFSGLPKLRERTALGLVRRRILRADEDKVLWIFTRKIYPERDSAPERAIVARMRRAIFTAQADVEARTVVLISLARAGGLLGRTFDKKKLKARKRRIERLVNGELCGKATKEAIEAAQAAIVVATMIPAMVAVTTAASR